MGELTSAMPAAQTRVFLSSDETLLNQTLVRDDKAGGFKSGMQPPQKVHSGAETAGFLARKQFSKEEDLKDQDLGYFKKFIYSISN